MKRLLVVLILLVAFGAAYAHNGMVHVMGTIAAVSASAALLTPFCPEVVQPWQESRRLLRAMDRSRRATNPENYQPNGTIKKGRKDWIRAGAQYEALLGDRWKGQGPLNSQEESYLTRAGVAYSLSRDDASLARLRARYIKAVDQSPAKDAMRVALVGVGVGDATPAAFGRVLGEVDSFSGWVSSMKKHILDKTSVRTAQAAPPKKG